ncbi:NAD(P)-binding protein-14 [Coleophoma crateriformis]|uniref:NAD(P)-binding protein-14 n=1 Tax=Coleophoma crateriformis TaxID=565419 RepID=A0A3D8QUT5_9HELO|nr:NAD(P)-binding protein-14 [Coleophoma crateriformis]
MASTKRLVVCGGNGFLGSRICRSAVARGWEVTSISISPSRSGEPTWSSVTSSPTPPSWAHKVTWERADILKPNTYSPLLKDADYVVHSMGILLEADYKGVVSGKESPLTGLKRAFSSTKAGSQNPLTRAKGEDLKPQEKDGQLTYELMNRDSAIALAREAAEHQVPAFVYISAAAGAPVLPARYITTKREAESTIASEFPRMRSAFVRPGFLYDSSRAFTVPLAAMTGLGAVFNSVTGGVFGGIMGAAGTKPLKADVVADAVVEALSDESVKGPIEIQEIEELAQKAWRKGML